MAAALAVYFLGWDMKMIQIPADVIKNAFHIDYLASFQSVDLKIYLYAVGFAFVASAETLLCVSAVRQNV